MLDQYHDMMTWRWYTYGEGSLGSPRDRLAVQQHLLHQHFTCILHAERNHGQTVTYENHIHAGMVGDMSAWEVMRSHHCYWLVLAVEALKGVDGDGFACIARSGTQGRVRARACLRDDGRRGRA